MKRWYLAIVLAGCYVEQPRQTTMTTMPPPEARQQRQPDGGEATGGFESNTPTQAPAPERAPAPTQTAAPMTAPPRAGESDGRREVVMPDVTHMTLEQATRTMRAAGITGEIETHGNGRVCGSTPGPGHGTIAHLIVVLTLC